VRRRPTGTVAGRTWLPVLVAVAVAVTGMGRAERAEAYELTTADRVAMLYTPQLEFSVEGDPLIKIGLIEGEEAIRFTPSGPIRVLPLGEGGPEMALPGGQEYTVTRVEGRPGTYRYWATVARGLPSERSRLAEVEAEWRGRGVEARRFSLGSIFAVRGTMFDNRQVIVGVGGHESREEAQALARQLEEEHGLSAELHVELVEYPTGLLRLTSSRLEVSVTHRDLLWISASEGTQYRLDATYFDGNPGDAQRLYVGALVFTLDRRGQLAMVNELPIERLLQGIVPAEIYASAPMDALRAQAVAARAEILADLGVRYLADPYMTCATTRCQVYAGAGAEHERTTQAIRDTRGMVLLYDGHLARAVYSASNGGSMGDFTATWGDAPLPYLQPRIDAVEVPERFRNGLDEAALAEFLEADLPTYGNIENFGGPRVHRWTVELSADELSEAVNARYAVGRVLGLEVRERDRSGRATRLFIRGSRDSVEVERELPIRRALGGLRSALFVLHVEQDAAGNLVRARLRGGGFGHGVGMCQTGSIGAAQRGLDYLAILGHYYPGTEPTRLWE
jgi:stage II sporulation protein D